MLFDFASYLSSRYPDSAWTISRLTGGFVHETVRANRIIDSATNCPNQAPLILKYAPFYVAGVGSAAPLAQSRQKSEAQALAFLDSYLYGRDPVEDQTVPSVVFQDSECHVLTLNDLGCLPTLSDVFAEVGRYNIKPNTVRSVSTFESLDFYSIGYQIGSFFARLHSQQTVAIAQSFYQEYDWHNLEELKPLNVNSTVKWLEDMLSDFIELSSDSDRIIDLSTLISADLSRSLHPNEISFVQGDYATGGILVSETTTPPQISIIDWEFSGLRHGPHGDIAPLLAYLFTFQIAADHNRRAVLREAISALTEALVAAYCVESEAEPWRQDRMLRENMRKSAMLAGGREMIQVAFWKIWICSDEECGTPHPSQAGKRKCKLIRRICEEGLRLIEGAAEGKRLPTSFSDVSATLSRLFDM